MLPTIRRRAYRPAYMSNFFDNDFDSFFTPRRTFNPAVNIKEDDKQYLIEMALPGINKEDVNIEIEKDVLIISSKKTESANDSSESYSRKEFAYESFCRSFSIPENVKAEKISASHKNGILNIELPKSEEDTKLNRVIKVS